MLTILKPVLQSLYQSQAFVQLLAEDLSHVVVDVAGLQQLLEGLVEVFQLLALQGAQAAALFDLLPELGQFPGLRLHQRVHPAEFTTLLSPSHQKTAGLFSWKPAETLNSVFVPY